MNSPANSSESERNRNVLVIDDFDVDRACYRRYMQRSKQRHYQVFEAESSEDAITLYQKCDVDIVLLDNSLPDIDVFSLLHHLLSVSKAHQPAIIVTAGDCEAAENIGKRTVQIGAWAYLIKEKITSQTLQATIDQAVEDKGQTVSA